MKETAAELSQTRESHRANPIALELGLLEGLGPGTMNLFAPTDEVELNPDGTTFNPVSRFYDHLLECCDGLFAGDMDQNTFEENLRFMFGTKGYLLFTIDKVIAALIKQVRTLVEGTNGSLTILIDSHGDHRFTYRGADESAKERASSGRADYAADYYLST